MQIPIEELHPEIARRLESIQKEPDRFAGFYQATGSPGLALAGVVLAVLLGAGALVFAFSGEKPWPPWAWAVYWFFCLWMGLAGNLYRRRYRQAPLKPFVFINPLYFTRVTLDEVRFHSLWKEMEDFDVTHHYTNGVYQHTAFTFDFGAGGKEGITVSPMDSAELLRASIIKYRDFVLRSIQEENLEEVGAHDLFIEVAGGGERSGDQRPSLQPRPGRRRAWPSALVGGAAAGALCFFINGYGYQGKLLRACRTIEDHERFLSSHSPNFHESAARHLLKDAYTSRFAANRNNAPVLRKLMGLAGCPHLTKEQEAEVLNLYRERGGKELDRIYEEVIAGYTRRAARQKVEPKAREAILALFAAARTKGLYRVRIAYGSKTLRLVGPFHFKTAGRRHPVVSPGPSFTTAHNAGRERAITERIVAAFGSILPRGILEFDPRGNKVAFHVGYVVFPRPGVVYSRRTAVLKKYYQGIGFSWTFRITIEGKEIYRFGEISYPPPIFRVAGIRSRWTAALSTLHGAASAGSVYDKMAQTAFAAFGAKILERFGIR